MSLLPDTASFHERVQDLFSAYRGRGVSLSGLDIELVDQWEQTGAPFEIIARGLRKAAEAALFDAPQGETGLRSLRACRAKVEAELKKYLASSAGAHSAEASGDKPTLPLHVARFKKLKAALKKVAKESPEYAPLLERVAAALTEPADYQHSQWTEDLAVALLLRGLPWAQRLTLLREGRASVEKAQVVSTAARQESRRFHRSALVRRALQLSSWW